MFTLKQEYEKDNEYKITLVTSHGNYGIFTKDKELIPQIATVCRCLRLSYTVYPNSMFIRI